VKLSKWVAIAGVFTHHIFILYLTSKLSFRKKELLRGLVNSGQLQARTKWKQVYPLFSSDSRYLDLLGKPGSNPLELFWDAVDELDQSLDAKIASAEAAIMRHNVQLEAEHGKAAQTSDVSDTTSPKLFAVLPETGQNEFIKVIKENADESVSHLTTDDLSEIYHTVRVTLTQVTDVVR